MSTDKFSTNEQLAAARSRIESQLEQLNAAYAGRPFPDSAKEEWNALNEQRDAIDERIAERDVREARLREFHSAGHVEELDGLANHPVTRAGRDAGLRTIERFRDKLSSDAGDRLCRLVDQHDTPTALGARYLEAVGAPAYLSAFKKIVKDPRSAHIRMTPQELEAIRRVDQIESERAMAVGTGSTGGFMAPFELDPSILLSGSGSVSPVRQIAKVEVTVSGTWKGVSADQVTAGYGAEAAEVADASPTLVQPVVTAQRGTAFVPFSIELDQDVDNLTDELARVLADGRDVLDSSKFLSGTGTNEPVGILSIGTAGALTTTQRVQTTATAAFAVGDVYLLKQALPARFVNDAVFAVHPTTGDTIYRLVAEASSTEPKQMADGRGGSLLGKSMLEWSSMATGTASTTKLAIYGDFRQFIVCDRLGFALELVPHLFGATNRFPTGQRGALAIWRTGTGVLVPNAFRYLEVR